MNNCVYDDENIKKLAKNIVSYYGYTVTRNGEIISPSGNLLHSYDFTYPNSHVTLRINNKKLKKNKAILVYELFSGEKLQRNKFIIQFKDGNSDNASYDNLYLVTRPEYWEMMRDEKNIGKKIGGKRFTDEQEEEIWKAYQTGNYSLRQLCNIYNACLVTIQGVIKRGNEKCQKEYCGS